MRYTKGYVEGLLTRAEACDLSCLRGGSVLVTGASGLIGSALADVLLCANDALGLGARLMLAGRHEASLRGRFFHWGRGAFEYVPHDLAVPLGDAPAADYVVHCAGNAHPVAYARSPVETVTGNVAGTDHVLSYARDHGVRRVLYLSSSEVYGSKEGAEPFREGEQCYVDPLSPRSCYPASKRACETLCASYLAEYGVDSVIARPGHIWGPMVTASDSRAHAQFAREAAAGRDIVMKSPGSQLRSYMYAVDCAGALLALLARGEAGRAYNVGVPGFTCTIRQLAEALATAGGVHIVQDFPTEGESASYNPMSCSALDCSRLAALGFRTRFSLGEAAAQTVECMREG